MKQCSVCSEKIKFGKAIVLEDDKKEKRMFCSECYLKMPKENKKKLTHYSGGIKLDAGGTVTGFALGGVFGAVYASVPEDEADNWVIKRSMKKYNYTLKQLNDLSIDLFNVHSAMLDERRHRALMDKFEGKTDSKDYIKYIQNMGLL